MNLLQGVAGIVGRRGVRGTKVSVLYLHQINYNTVWYCMKHKRSFSNFCRVHLVSKDLQVQLEKQVQSDRRDDEEK